MLREMSLVKLTIDGNKVEVPEGTTIYKEDEGKVIRKSHENPYILKLYDEFLGEPLSEKAHELLHTHFFDKRKKIFQV
jgi:iron only hydrogenase large subunit-like protein